MDTLASTRNDPSTTQITGQLAMIPLQHRLQDTLLSTCNDPSTAQTTGQLAMISLQHRLQDNCYQPYTTHITGYTVINL